jgi:hypothetical protein
MCFVTEVVHYAYMNYLGTGVGSLPQFAALGPLFIIIIVWSLVWKGLALWHSAQRGQMWWFLVLMILNTVGILEIIYLFAIAKLTFSELFSNKLVTGLQQSDAK